jgi:diadenosine tetraphosphate (Ap4A) HIT family hydrolase
MMDDRTCPFCERLANGPRWHSEYAAAFPDVFPISPGHTLVVPRSHEPDFFNLTSAERDDIWHLVETVRRDLVAELHPDGCNIGINVGAAAGQTIAHAHVHVIPRYEGDVTDPRGGIRWILPERAAYWSR